MEYELNAELPGLKQAGFILATASLASQRLTRNYWIITNKYGNGYFDVQKESALIYNFSSSTGLVDSGSSTNEDLTKYSYVLCILPGAKYLDVGDVVKLGFYSNNLKRPYIKQIIRSHMGKEALTPIPEVELGFWLTPEGTYRLQYSNLSNQKAIIFSEALYINESLEKIQSGGGSSSYEDQRYYTDPCGLIRYSIGEDDYLLVYWIRWTSSFSWLGRMGHRLYKIGSDWEYSPFFMGASPSARLRVDTSNPFYPARKQGYLFCLLDNLANPLLVMVRPGNSQSTDTDTVTGGFWVQRHADLGVFTPTFHAWAADAILDRADPGPDDTGKLFSPIERSGSVAAADNMVLECYWSGWRSEGAGGTTDEQSSDRSKLHCYRIATDTLAVTTTTLAIQTVLQGAFGGNVSEILAVGILDPHPVRYMPEGWEEMEEPEPETREIGYRLQLASTRFPFQLAPRKFWLQIPILMDQSGNPNPRIVNARLAAQTAELELAGYRDPATAIDEPYPGFIAEQIAAIQAAIPEYSATFPDDYLEQTAISGIVRRFYSDPEGDPPGDGLCHYYPGFGDPEIPDQRAFYYAYNTWISTITEQFWAGINDDLVAQFVAEPVGGLIVPMPLPAGVTHFDEESWIEDNQGRNHGCVPSGACDSSDNVYNVECRPKRVLTALSQYPNSEYAGEYPDTVEESTTFTTAQSMGGPAHEDPCFAGPVTVATRYHPAVAIQAQYETAQRYYRTHLVVSNSSGSLVSDVDISCEFTLTDTTPRLERTTAAFNVFQWGVVGSVIFILRLWPRNWSGPDTSYSTLSDVLSVLEPVLEIRSKSSYSTVLYRQRLRPSSNTGEPWNPDLNYTPFMLLSSNEEGLPQAHVWTNWKAAGDTEPKHSRSNVLWNNGVTVTEQLSASAAKPSGEPNVLEATVCVHSDNKVYWIDDNSYLRAKEL